MIGQGEDLVPVKRIYKYKPFTGRQVDRQADRRAGREID